MMKVSGHILYHPIVRYSGNSQIEETQLKKGGWHLIKKYFAVPAEASNWSFLQVCSQNDEQIVQPSDLTWNARQLEAPMLTYGIEHHETFICPQTSRYERGFQTLRLEGNVDSWDCATDSRNEGALRERLKYFKGKEVRLLLITLPAKKTKVYDIIKRAADVHVGIHTICAVTGWQ
jgi:hypothetical protein